MALARGLTVTPAATGVRQRENCNRCGCHCRSNRNSGVGCTRANPRDQIIWVSDFANVRRRLFNGYSTTFRQRL